jgi:thiamine-monophosphate kinase
MPAHPHLALFAARPDEAIAALGERRLITELHRWLGAACPPPPAGIGDDCAVLPPTARPRLVTVDPVIYGEHIDDRVPPTAAGAKLLKRNLSDIAAMGGRPTHAVLALALDPRVSRHWLEKFYRGLATVARAHGVQIVGGDVATHRGGFVATLTLLGEATAPAGRVLTRAGARVGDFLAVTGRLGGSLPSRRHYRFTPRLAEGAWLAARHEVRAMMDLSDGLAKDVHALMPADGEPALAAALIPRHAGCDLAAALGDGEDYELLLALAPDTDWPHLAAAWRKRFPRVPLTPIGEIVARGQRPAEAIDLSAYRGFEHFAVAPRSARRR